jgi:hypothetical protein
MVLLLQHLTASVSRNLLVSVFNLQHDGADVQRRLRSSLRCRSGAWAAVSTSPLLYDYQGRSLGIFDRRFKR